MTHTSRNTGFWYRSDAGRNDGVISDADTYDSGLLVELRGDRSLTGRLLQRGLVGGGGGRVKWRGSGVRGGR